MIIEQFIFTVISLAIFVYMFFKMIRNNDTSYIVILICTFNCHTGNCNDCRKKGNDFNRNH